MKYFPHENHSPVAQALRKAGFVPLPRLWVRPDDVPAVKAIAFQYADEVNRIRYEAKGQDWIDPSAKADSPVKGDPLTDPDAAWDLYEQQKKRMLE